LFIFIIGNYLICCNLGDIINFNKKNNQIFNLSNEHKPNNKNEYEKIIKKMEK
jgi:serine/threonine protein phosphatase PrpC